MKKLLIALFSVLMLAGCANDPYKIDPVATANAPWAVGEVVFRFGVPLHSVPGETVSQRLAQSASVSRIFLGVNRDGFYVLQEFYDDYDSKLSDPYLVSNVMGISGDEPTLCHGRVTLWYLNGQKRRECFFNNGTTESPCITWYETGEIGVESNYKDGLLNGSMIGFHTNGNREFEAQFQNNRPIGIVREWDENGNLIDETDYGTP